MEIPPSFGDQGLPVKALIPCCSFTNVDEFVWRHEQATLIEMSNEELVVKRLNEKKKAFRAWPVAPIPGMTTRFMKSWLFLVRMPSSQGGDDFPTLTDRFFINMTTTVTRAEGTFSLVNLAAARIPNPYERSDHPGGQEVTKCAAFRLDVPRSWKSTEGDQVEMDLMATFQTATSIGDTQNITVGERNYQVIIIEWESSLVTFEAELAALHRLADNHRLEEQMPSQRSLRAFRTILDFKNPGWVTYRNLHHEFPQLEDPSRFSRHVPRLLVKKFKALNGDHQAALDGLKRIPNCLYFVNGCPGSGKTEWNLLLSALIQSKRSPNSKRRHTPILFLVDINKTVDDAAHRYQTLCRQAGLKLRVIRMHGWPYEMRHSVKLNQPRPEAQGTSEAEVDFTKRFLATIGLVGHAMAPRSPNEAPTLDEASWEYYELHKHDCFPGLRKLLARMEEGDAFSSEEWKALRGQVTTLYRAVLAQADFVATTPVATYGSFSKLYKPDLIFMDEAPHARELTTLIPIAFFSPLAWILTGDIAQTRPFVKSGSRQTAKRDGLRFNPFARQLELSTMARAAAAGATNAKLLVNNRGHAKLHRLPSDLFYNGEMVSAYDDDYSASVKHLNRYLARLSPRLEMNENRLVVWLRDSCEKQHRSSFWNPVNHEWVLRQVKELLADKAFVTVDGGSLGTIMISTPYSTAAREYIAATRMWPPAWLDRVEILTIDKSQGNQADVVFLDLVRTVKAGFVDDPYRLNVAITRARQAEIILMHHGMTWKTERGRGSRRSKYLRQLWDDAVRGRRMASL